MLYGLIAVSLVATYFIVRAYRLALRNLELEETIISQYAQIDAESDVVKESFLKFVSDSREWAYSYIEEVQKALTSFKNEVDPLISYFDQYGDVISNQRPDYDSMKKISAAYKELILVLPEEDNAKT